MADFSHLKALAITRETTREYTFDRIPGAPSLIVSPATDDNEDFLHARLDLAFAEPEGEPAGDKPKVRTDSGKVTPEDMIRQYDENREIDRKLIAQACVRNWGTAPVDKNGKEVAFSPEAAIEFLSALQNYMFDPFRTFCGNVYNFAPSLAKPKPSGEKLGNS